MRHHIPINNLLTRKYSRVQGVFFYPAEKRTPNSTMLHHMPALIQSQFGICVRKRDCVITPHKLHRHSRLGYVCVDGNMSCAEKEFEDKYKSKSSLWHYRCDFPWSPTPRTVYYLDISNNNSTVTTAEYMTLI